MLVPVVVQLRQRAPQAGDGVVASLSTFTDPDMYCDEVGRDEGPDGEWARMRSTVILAPVVAAASGPLADPDLGAV